MKRGFLNLLAALGAWRAGLPVQRIELPFPYCYVARITYDPNRYRNHAARIEAAAAKRARRRERNLRLAYCGAIQFTRGAA